MRTIDYLAVTAMALGLAWIVGTTAVGAITASFAKSTALIEGPSQ